MFRIQVNNFEKKDLLKELLDEFLPPQAYEVSDSFPDEMPPEDILINVNRDGVSDLNAIKRELYKTLAEFSPTPPDWGILTGVRPVKLAGELTEKLGRTQTFDALRNTYLISEDKTNLILDMYEHQKNAFGIPDKNSVSLYIGIPFCPSRCSYCAFASNQEDYQEIEKYLDALEKEIDFVAEEMNSRDIVLESLYIGGGTPTVLNHEDINRLMDKINKSFNLASLKEYTVEAGRPDTIDKEKLEIIKSNGVDRISINPQSMKEETMMLIGRAHKPGDIERAFAEAIDVGFNSINMDLIAGLPGETLGDFRNSLDKIIKMNPENITVHSLAVKRASRLKEENPELYLNQSEAVRSMVGEALSILTKEGYIPYYLYRQKHMAGACENIGYSKPGKEGLYNIRIMDEHQTNIALGAGGISKIYFPEENRLERVANVTNYREYINRIDEMINRKREGVFNAYNSTKRN